MSDDQSRIYNSLRASTIALLGYDSVDPLSSAQEIRISRAISLRLIVDAAQAKQLRGEPIDVKAFTDASESLEKLCGGNPEASTTGPDSGVLAELDHQLDRQMEMLERNMARDPDAARAEFEARLARAIEKHGKPISNPGSGDAQSGDGVTLPPSAAFDAPAARSGHPVLIAPPEVIPTVGQTPSPPRRVESAEEKMSRVNNQRPPDHYLQGPREAWRDYVNSDGSIRTSPWRRW
jgi:hypothetical protein